jgi:hypothetical protein
MVYCTWKNHVFGLRPSSISKKKFRKLDLFPSSGKMAGTPTLLGPLRRAKLNQFYYLRMETDLLSETLCFFRNIRRFFQACKRGLDCPMARCILKVVIVYPARWLPWSPH